MTTKEDILRLIEEEDVEFIRLQFVDMFGNLKNVAVTPGQLDRVMNNEYSFYGGAMFDEKYPCEEEFYLHPDLDSFTILPWRPQQGRVGKFICDVYDADGKLYELSPRTILKNHVKTGRSKGYILMVESECEFFLFHTDENGIPTIVTHERAGYMDVGPADLGENARRDMVLNLEQMGFDIESSHHEKAPAQHEIDFAQNETLLAADALVTFKFAVRSIAKRFGLYATFMPKPKKGVAGSGLHLNFTLYKDGEKVFNKPDSPELKMCVAGLLKYAKDMCLITNPLVNSYKRLNSGYDAPCEINYGSKGEKVLVKTRKCFEDTKLEVRFPDPSANPYLALSVCIAAGLRGLEEGLDPDKVIAELGEDNTLPENMWEALKIFKNSEFVRNVLGDKFVDIYSQIKEAEWKDYMLQVSDWEIDRYLSKM